MLRYKWCKLFFVHTISSNILELSLNFIFKFLGKYCSQEDFSLLDEAGKREEYKVAGFFFIFSHISMRSYFILG